MLTRYRRLTWIIAGGLVLLAALYSWWWRDTANRLDAAILDWTRSPPWKALTISHGGTRVSGFPLDHRIRLTRPMIVYTGDDKPVVWQASDIAVRVSLWNRNTLTATLNGRHRVSTGGTDIQPTNLTAGLAEMSAAVSTGGNLTDLSATIRALNITSGPWAGMAVRELTFRISPSAPSLPAPPTDDPRQPAAMALNLNITDLDLPPDAGGALGRRVGAQAALVLRGKINGPTLPEALQSWRKAGGMVDIGTLDFNWGPLAIAADGSAALDDELQPIMSLATRTRGWRAGMDALVAAGIVRSRDGSMAVIGLSLLSKISGDASGTRIHLPLAIQDSYLSAGPIRLAPIPQISWQ